MKIPQHRETLELLASAVEDKDAQLEREQTPEVREQLLAEINILAEQFESFDRLAGVE